MGEAVIDRTKFTEALEYLNRVGWTTGSVGYGSQERPCCVGGAIAHVITGDGLDLYSSGDPDDQGYAKVRPYLEAILEHLGLDWESLYPYPESAIIDWNDHTPEGEAKKEQEVKTLLRELGEA